MKMPNNDELREIAIQFLLEGNELAAVAVLTKCRLEVAEAVSADGMICRLNVTLRCPRPLLEQLVNGSGPVAVSDLLLRIRLAVGMALPCGFAVANLEPRAGMGAAGLAPGLAAGFQAVNGKPPKVKGSGPKTPTTNGGPAVMPVVPPGGSPGESSPAGFDASSSTAGFFVPSPDPAGKEGELLTRGRFRFRPDFREVWVGGDFHDLQDRHLARLCLQYLYGAGAFGPGSARHFVKEINPHVRARMPLKRTAEPAEIKLHHYFISSHRRLERLSRLLVRSAGRGTGRYYLCFE